MNETLDSLLKKNEELLWLGGPENFELMDKSNEKSIKIGTIIKVIAFSALIVAYFLSSSGDIKIGILAFILAVAVYLVLNPFLIANSLRKKVSYAVTDKRLILLIGSEGKGVEYSAIKDAAFKADSAGHISLLCGKDALRLRETKWRSAATTQATIDTETGVCDSLVFYALPEADKIKELISQYISL